MFVYEHTQTIEYVKLVYLLRKTQTLRWNNVKFLNLQ